MSTFESDLNDEQILTEYLDFIYSEIGLSTTRVFGLDEQNKGIDLYVTYNNKRYTIDEKSQLHYLNKRLPTFAFELSYLKNGAPKKGWLFDEKKITQYYFLMTEIFLHDDKSKLSSKNDVASIKVISVNRAKLISLLELKGIDAKNIDTRIKNLRESKAYGKQTIIELNRRKEGTINYNDSLAEQPINLVLKLDFLVKEGVAKVIYQSK